MLRIGQRYSESIKYRESNQIQVSIDIVETWYRTITTVNFVYTPSLGLNKIKKYNVGGFVHFCHKGKGFCPRGVLS